MIADLLANLVLKKIYNHLVLSNSGAPYSIRGASSLRGARSGTPCSLVLGKLAEE